MFINGVSSSPNRGLRYIETGPLTATLCGHVPLHPPILKLDGNVEYGTIRHLVEQRFGFLTYVHGSKVIAYPDVYGPEFGHSYRLMHHIPIEKTLLFENGAQVNIICDSRRRIYKKEKARIKTCPFCTPDENTIIARIHIDSEKYSLLVNRFHWSLNGMVMASEDHLDQVLTERQMAHVLIILKALGLSYKAAFNSLSAGASLDHFHAHYYCRDRENVWEFASKSDQYRDGWLQGWPAMSYMLNSEGPRKTAKKAFQNRQLSVTDMNNKYNILMDSFYGRLSALLFPRLRTILEPIPGRQILCGSNFVSGHIVIMEYNLYEQLERIADTKRVLLWYGQMCGIQAEN